MHFDILCRGRLKNRTSMDCKKEQNLNHCLIQFLSEYRNSSIHEIFNQDGKVTADNISELKRKIIL